MRSPRPSSHAWPSTNNCGKGPQKGPEIFRLEGDSWAGKWRVGIDSRQRRDYLILVIPAVYPVGAPESSSQPVSELLLRWKAGDQQALERLVPLVYKELRDIAHYHLQRERPGHTLQSTALVHEAYLRFLDQKPFDAENRTHFLAVASRQMRQILVDYARSRAATKQRCRPQSRTECGASVYA